jgi:hypothetical protein
MMTRHRKQGLVPEKTDADYDGCVPRVPRNAEKDKAAPTLLLDSTITCPKCDTSTRLHMPTDACQFFWECPACGALLKPKRGDCCVFCSWGDVPCPPVQAGRNGGR